MEWHIWSGLAVLTLLVFRLLWGLVGSSTARLSALATRPAAILDNLRGKWRGVGHSPLGALSVIALLGLISVQLGLGLFASDEDGLFQGPLSHLVSFEVSEAAAELHEELFDVLLVFIGLHVAAVFFYLVFLRKDLIGPMIGGRAVIAPGAQPMRPGKWWAALVCLIIAVAVTWWIADGARFP